MRYANDLSGGTHNVWKPTSLVAAVGVGIALVVIGTALALGLGIGLHSPGTEGNDGNINLTIIIALTTTTTASSATTTTTITSTTTTTTTTTRTSTTTTTTTTTATTTILITVTFQGNLTNTSALFNSLSSSALNYSYDAIDVTVGTSGNYTLQSSSTTNYTFYGYLYNNSFSAFSPFTNLLARTDETIGGSLQFSITYNLLYGVEYVLVVTSINQTVPASYTITSIGPGTTTFVHQTPVTLAVVYGTVSNSGTDDGSNGNVQINAQDVITGVDGVTTMGYVDQVYFSFNTAPSTTTPLIYLYVMNQTSALVFVPTITYQIPYASITTGTTGVQNISLPFNQLPVVSGQYIGVGFSTGGGSLYSVPGRSQYFLSGVTNFLAVTSATYSSTTTAFAFSFRVQVVTVIYG